MKWKLFKTTAHQLIKCKSVYTNVNTQHSVCLYTNIRLIKSDRTFNRTICNTLIHCSWSVVLHCLYKRRSTVLMGTLSNLCSGSTFKTSWPKNVKKRISSELSSQYFNRISFPTTKCFMPIDIVSYRNYTAALTNININENVPVYVVIFYLLSITRFGNRHRIRSRSPSYWFMICPNDRAYQTRQIGESTR